MGRRGVNPCRPFSARRTKERDLSEQRGRRLHITGRTLTFDADPRTDEDAARYTEKGAVLIGDGRILWCGQAGDEPR